LAEGIWMKETEICRERKDRELTGEVSMVPGVL